MRPQIGGQGARNSCRANAKGIMQLASGRVQNLGFVLAAAHHSQLNSKTANTAQSHQHRLFRETPFGSFRPRPFFSNGTTPARTTGVASNDAKKTKKKHSYEYTSTQRRLEHREGQT
jgi:hypothetical protein